VSGESPGGDIQVEAVGRKSPRLNGPARGHDELVICSLCGHPFWLIQNMLCVEAFGTCPECGSPGA
jgi:hypothetical protein